MASRTVQYATPSRDDYNRLTDDQKTRVGEAFDLFDSNKDGLLSYEEFRFVLRALGFELPKATTYDLLVRHAIKPTNWPHDQDCPPVYRLFNLATLQAIAGTLIRQRDPREELRRAFRLFDVDGKGMITQEDLRRVSKQVGNNIPDADIVAMVEEFDASGKGGVDEDEFLRLMLSKK
ncbi:cell division control protein 31 [Podospora australis]|uniref:Calmodulin n=1 Tax=Podospora australis TaxID=1536484 RepID=A0AAN7AHZ9_9PEZI|nr:cell division control protein 31 [Podospora australis]